jgi:hypothetical protein
MWPLKCLDICAKGSPLPLITFYCLRRNGSVYINIQSDRRRRTPELELADGGKTRSLPRPEFPDEGCVFARLTGYVI